MAGGDPSAATDRDGWIRAAVERFEGPLTRYAVRVVGEVEAARDIVQETFLKLCGQDRGRVEPHLAEWLFTVCRNRALDVLRKEGRVSRSRDPETRLGVVPAADADPADGQERRDELDRVLRLMAMLPESQQEVIRLRFQEGFSYKEISRITGFSVGNVGYLLHMGLKSLRGRLGVPDDGAASPGRHA
ncbi:RNA polymerase sigma factor [Tautonia plasticadhaerens]|uniref:ECF RNA polymerase sigma factor RpoE n=1 Tax=Tautonia plasticadhaerens TaxID=2527974 RepID=A0A518H3N8_9BACT|nr:sigma-70 family RNA polymerase sigma factor [Tautonia plasticadhaerens]QDV35437.1 ECF RNA polymerase sigma factor RpoE [Tautonia plasticadhaerens]